MSYVLRLTAYDMVKIVLCMLALFCNVAGNGLTLIAIWKTPKLRTKSDMILCSLTVSDLIVAVDIVSYTFLSTTIIVSPTKCTVMSTILAPFSKAPVYISSLHLIVVAVDRYVAIVHPFSYEDRLTDGVVRAMLAAAWTVGLLLGISQWMWLINSAARPVCATVAPAYGWLAVALFIAVVLMVVPMYVLILKVAWSQHVRIHLEMPIVSNSCNVTVMSSATPDQQQDDRNEPHRTQVQQQPDQQHSEASRDWEHKRAKARVREFKAVYLTTAVVFSFAVLWFPFVLGRGLEAAGRSGSSVAILLNVGNGFGITNSCFNWLLYGAVSRKYRQAYWRLLSCCVR